jgi:hypothetical protein
MRTIPALLLFALATGCGDQPFQPDRSLRLALQASGLLDGGSAEYRIFVEDTVAVAHGQVSEGETDTVRISSSEAVRVSWQDAPLTLDSATYIFAPLVRDTVIDQSDRDTTVTLPNSYQLASGGFVLTAPGIPAQAAATWQVWSNDTSVAGGNLRAGEVLRRGDMPLGNARLQLDTVVVEIGGVHHAYAPPERDTPLSISPTLDLIPVEAPYALSSVPVRLGPSGLPAETLAPWVLQLSGSFDITGSAPTGSLELVELVPAGSYTLQWGEVTVDGTTYRPDPASQTVALDPQIEPYDFQVTYSAAP